jgi:hypothetical protein
MWYHPFVDTPPNPIAADLSPAPLVSLVPSLVAVIPPDRRPRAHKETCICRLCNAVRSRLAAGLPKKEIERAMAKAQRLINGTDKTAEPRNDRERAVATHAAIVAATTALVDNGTIPEATAVARAAGVPIERAKLEVSVPEALDRAGITDSRLDSVALSGLDAEDTRLIIQDGIVTDAVGVPDWKARHNFWRDLNLMKGRLRPDEQQIGGGLIIVAPHEINLTPGHPPNCQCAKCALSWEAEAVGAMRRVAREQQAARTVDGEVVEPDPETTDPQDSPIES